MEKVKEDENHKEMIDNYLDMTNAEAIGHFNQNLAMQVVSKMKPILHTDLNEFMKEKGLTPDVVFKAVKDVEKDTIDTYAKKDIKLPCIPEEYNKFDYYVCMAEKLDHNYVTIGDDLNKGALLVYEGLSDYDGGTRKVWDRTKHYLED